MTGSESSKESRAVLVGLCAVVASTVLVEICLTKFVSYKVYHHYVYAIISTVILSSGFAGICVHLFPKLLGKQSSDPWAVISKSCFAYAILLMVATTVFCWLPFDAYWKAFSVPAGLFVYFFLFSIPCFFAGIAIAATIALSKRPVTTIYFYDLVAAAVGALVLPFAFEWLGGYGTIVAASTLAMVSAFAFARMSPAKLPVVAGTGIFVVVAALFMMYPGWAMSTQGFDIFTKKEVLYEKVIKDDFHGIARTYWSPVARIDVTNSGLTDDIDYVPGDKPYDYSVKARFIMVDASAPTRQVQINGDITKDPILVNMFWATPYAAHKNAKRSLVIGAGGGIDVLIAKRYKMEHVDAIEVNPATYKHCLLGQGDPEAHLYQPALQSTADTKVELHNTEARHFCTMLPPQSVDIVHATGVDTITAASSGALTMVENYLYTLDAVRDYMRILKPDGMLSLTHWRGVQFTSLRQLRTYLLYLDSLGIKEPWKHIVVLGNSTWTDEVLKATPFTEEEVERLREFAKKNNFTVLVDPFRKEALVPGMLPTEAVYYELVHAAPKDRPIIADKLPYDTEPSTDDKPFFYKLSKTVEPLLETFRGSSAPMFFLLTVAIASLVIFSIPLFRMDKKVTPHPGRLRIYALAFAAGGFAFLLFEIAILQSFSVFVGGPMASLCVTLVAVMAGYGCGSLTSPKLGASFRTFFGVGVTLAAVFAALYVFLPGLIHAMMPLGSVERIATSAAIVFAVAFLTGLTPGLAMQNIKQTHGDAVAWMWGISCSCNAIGALSFPILAGYTGVGATFLVSAVLFFIANLDFAALQRKYEQDPPVAPVEAVEA